MASNRSQKRPLKKINQTMSHKLAALFILVLLAFVLLALRITYINAMSGDRYKKQVMSQAQSRYESRVLPAKRGDIYDRNGNLLASSQKIYNVILDCKVVNEKDEYVEPTVQALVELLGISESDVRTRLNADATRESQYQVLKRQLPLEEKKTWDEYVELAYVERNEQGEAVKEEDKDKPKLSKEETEWRQNIQGVWFEEDYLRNYPYAQLACDTIGFTFSRDNASYGLEGYYNALLTGVDGRQYGYFNSNSDIEQTIISPTNGSSIITSLDTGVQTIVEKYVDAYRHVVGGQHVGVIVEDPNTGEILAMDGGDRYDLNNPHDLSLMYSEEIIDSLNDAQTVEVLSSIWSNYTISDTFEPGSVVKPIIMAAAMEKGTILSSDTFPCDGAQVFGAAGDVTIRCAVWPDAHGQQTLADIIANSCNDGMMQIGAKMGAQLFVKEQSVFNFGSRTGIDLPWEAYGTMHTTESMGETELACSAFGQGFTCTMIQECNALCSIVNGGNYYLPHLVTAIRDSSGNTVKSFQPTLLRQTVSSTISSDIREYMKECVTRGTGTHAAVLGYSMGGKTGTAEKLPRGNGNYLVSFIGFAPVSNPRVVVYCIVDEPNVEDQSKSIYPQYIVQGIMKELLPYLGVSPDEPNEGRVEQTQLWEGFRGVVPTEVNGEMDSSGYLVNEDGYRIDWDGNRIDDNGYLLDERGNYQKDSNGNYIRSTNMDGISGNIVPEGVSNLNSPQPPAENANARTSANMESEGITNEEAGLE